MVRTSLDGALVADVLADLAGVHANADGPAPSGRQPVHTCYVAAHLLTADLPAAWGAAALTALTEHAPDAATLASIVDQPAGSETAYGRLRAKLRREPIEDLRIDFEDGYGVRSDTDEDADAERAADLVAGWRRSGAAPPSVGIRFKSFDTPELLHRGVRTLDVFLTALVSQPGAMAGGVALTLPKVIAVEQVTALCQLLETLEQRLGLAEAALRFEIQIETTRSILDPWGRLAVPRLISAGRGRVSGLHFGTYDYTAGCGLGPGDQHLAHCACDFARNVMQVSAAGTGVQLSDGSTNVLPVGDAESVRHGWRTHHQLVLRSLRHGFYQGWDLHPAQLVTRYAAVYGYYLAEVPAVAARLGRYLAGSTGGAVADEPATARALAATLRRAVDCGAFTDTEVADLVGDPDWAGRG